MTIKDPLADKGSSPENSVNVDSPELFDSGKGKIESGSKVLAIIMEAARKATEEVIKRRKVAAEELAMWREALREEAARNAAEEKAVRKAAVEETARNAAEETATRKAAVEEAAEAAAEEKAARKAAKKQKAAEKTAQWAAESIRALGDGVALSDEDAVTAARNVCDSLDWKYLKNVTGAQIAYSQDEDFSDSKVEKVKMSHDLKELDKQLEAGKEYYVRVRLYAAGKNKKHYSDWSEVITLKT